MATPQLPERPDLEQLKRQAKDLLRSAKSGQPDALARFRTLPAYARDTGDTLAASLALHDAQSVIARELGFASWKALLERVEELTLEFDAAIVQFVEAATEVQPARAERLLRLHPRMANADFHAALVLGVVPRIESHLAEDPQLATKAGGPRSWEPLLYLCYTSVEFGPEARAEGLVSCARLLLSRGADPNTRFPWLHHGVRRPALWGAMLVTRHVPLARVLLESGANANDGITLPLVASGTDVAALDLLHAYGADVNQPWASDGSSTLYAMLNWSESSIGVRWLLDHGADPDPVFPVNGETPLHVVARCGSAELCEMLVGRGANVERRRADGRMPYAVAELSGNRDVADWLARHGASTELSDVDRFVAACSRGDRPTAEAMLRSRPGLPNELGSEHYAGFYRAAERGDAEALDTMLACGFDPNHGDEIGKTALHAAAMEGRPAAVRVLLDHGASVAVRDREFHAQPLVWAAEGLRSQRPDHRDHQSVGRLLLDAGSPVQWEGNEEPSAEILQVIGEWRRSRENAS